jgi:hypothetical protein
MKLILGFHCETGYCNIVILHPQNRDIVILHPQNRDIEILHPQNTAVDVLHPSACPQFFQFVQLFNKQILRVSSSLSNFEEKAAF